MPPGEPGGGMIFIADVDRVSLLQVAHQLEDAGRIDDAELLKGVVVGERESSRLVPVQEVSRDEVPQFPNKGFHVC